MDDLQRETAGTMTCGECGRVFVLYRDGDPSAFMREVDDHLAEHRAR